MYIRSLVLIHIHVCFINSFFNEFQYFAKTHFTCYIFLTQRGTICFSAHTIPMCGPVTRTHFFPFVFFFSIFFCFFLSTKWTFNSFVLCLWNYCVLQPLFPLVRICILPVCYKRKTYQQKISKGNRKSRNFYVRSQ